jgi:hypothetical protein
MRATRSVLVLVVSIATLLAVPTTAAANGGASLVLNRTHYLAGDEGVATASVFLPAERRGILERGPFYLFLAPRTALREGRPIPEDAIRLGTFTVEPGKDGWVELRAPFVTPRFDAGFYSVEVCNDPCTVAGFREPLIGSISIVGTRREAMLLVENDRLRSRLFGMRREARRAERRLEAVEADLEAQLSFGASERSRLSSDVTRLQGELAAVRSELATARDRDRTSPWLLGAILLVVGVAAVLAFRRGRTATIGPIEDDVPEPRRDADARSDASSPDGTNGHRRAEDRVWARPR